MYCCTHCWNECFAGVRFPNFYSSVVKFLLLLTDWQQFVWYFCCCHTRKTPICFCPLQENLFIQAPFLSILCVLIYADELGITVAKPHSVNTVHFSIFLSGVVNFIRWWHLNLSQMMQYQIITTTLLVLQAIRGVTEYFVDSTLAEIFRVIATRSYHYTLMISMVVISSRSPAARKVLLWWKCQNDIYSGSNKMILWWW